LKNFLASFLCVLKVPSQRQVTILWFGKSHDSLGFKDTEGLSHMDAVTLQIPYMKRVLLPITNPLPPGISMSHRWVCGGKSSLIKEYPCQGSRWSSNVCTDEPCSVGEHRDKMWNLYLDYWSPVRKMFVCRIYWTKIVTGCFSDKIWRKELFFLKGMRIC
jgi:hypothetical protein